MIKFFPTRKKTTGRRKQKSTGIGRYFMAAGFLLGFVFGIAL